MLEITASPASFFHEKLHRYRLEPGLEFYMVTVLSDYISSRPACLAFALRDALEAPPQTRVRHFKDMGDYCLAISGVHRKFAETKMTGRRYVESMGQNAYSQAASLVKDQDFADLYRKLSQDLPSLAELVHSILK